jgi:acyl-coenzyme A synthetase/AMP-(fatty) acid ligase
MQSNTNKTFFHDLKDNTTVSYDDLFSYVVGIEPVLLNSFFNNTKDFLFNLTKALYYNINITLNDVNNQVDDATSFKDFNNNPKNISELIEGISKSKSKITLFTSGTTGQPKKITHSVSNLFREVRKSEKFKENVWAFAYNPTHMAGLQVFFQALSNKNIIHNIFEYPKNDIITVINKYKITNISATPTFYRLLVPLKDPIVSVKNVSLGGEKSSTDLIKKISNSFPNAKILNIYASTEAGTLFSTSGSYFKILPSKINLVKIVNGELLIHKSLLGEHQGIEFKEVWYQSGDMVQIINPQTNEFVFTSRKNEMINVGGNNVNPIEIETIIDEIPGVKKSYVYGKPNPILGNMLYVKIQLNIDNITELSIKQYLNNKLERFQIPRRIEFVKQLSLTRSGKLKRNL